MMVPLQYVDEQSGFYEAADFNDPSKTRKYAVVPIRFIRACKNGHMGDIDWRYFVHRARTECARNLWLDDMGATGELSEATGQVRVRCVPIHQRGGREEQSRAGTDATAHSNGWARPLMRAKIAGRRAGC